MKIEPSLKLIIEENNFPLTLLPIHLYYWQADSVEGEKTVMITSYRYQTRKLIVKSNFKNIINVNI
jgi:hypothetical protein